MHTDGEAASVDIAIIGGGCSGAMTAVNLVDQHRRSRSPVPLSLCLIDDAEQVARGIAYGTTFREHLLNVSASGMSAFARDPGHFAEWLLPRLPESVPQTFAPRMVFGDYLTELLEEAKSCGDSDNISLTVMRQRAAAIELVGDKARIKLSSGQTLLASYVVLALGNFASVNSQFGAKLDQTARARFHENPWDAGIAQAVLPDDDVVLIGTGLTMIDVVLMLKSNGHRGHIHAISRHGYLPQPHFDLQRLAKEKPTSYLPSPLPDRLTDIFSVLRRSVKAAEAEAPGNWRCVMTELRAVTAQVWRRLSLVDRSRFLRHIRQLWEVHRHRMAPEIAEQVKNWRDTGVLTVCAERVVELSGTAGGIAVVSRPRGQSTTRRTVVQHVIECTGPKTDFRTIGDPLIVQMRSSGLLHPDELGLGARIGDDGALVNCDGVASTILYAMTSLRKGTLWETTAVPEIRQQANDLSELLLRQISLDAKPEEILSQVDARKGLPHA
jgi:uncharacterized NAD(P)/FAD-binding protein YdhS